MKILGINETSHDASISLIENGKILFAAHSERYSKLKNDWYINDNLVNDVLSYGTPDAIAYYEKPLLKASRLFLRGGYGEWKPRFDIADIPRKSFKHHYSHACAGYYTSKFDDAVIVVLDAIGEYNTLKNALRGGLQLDESSRSQVTYLNKYLGNYDISKIENHFLIRNGERAVILAKHSW